MDRVRQHYLSTLERKGIALTGSQLLDWARSQRLPKIRPAELYKFLRESAPAGLGAFSRRNRVRHYQTLSPARPGTFFIDYGEFHKNWAGSNNGATGFLVAVENLSLRLFVLPTRGKDTRQWLDSIARFVELSRQVSTIYSDRDSVAASKTFRKKLMADYKIRWYFLKSRHKSYLAERFIGLVKTKLSQALLWEASRRDGKPTKRWIDFVTPFLEEYNAQRVSGTSYRRRAVSRENYQHFLRQLFGGDPNYDLRFNSFAVGEFGHHPRWNSRIFKFKLGDRVRVSRKVDWADADNRNAAFKKASMHGGYGQKIYTVVGRQLRATKNNDRYVAVYALEGLPGEPAFTFYDEDLVRASERNNL
jgi:hypothetical protein